MNVLVEQECVQIVFRIWWKLTVNFTKNLLSYMWFHLIYNNMIKKILNKILNKQPFGYRALQIILAEIIKRLANAFVSVLHRGTEKCVVLAETLTSITADSLRFILSCISASYEKISQVLIYYNQRYFITKINLLL